MLRVRRTSQEPRVEMAPLIDVVFLLLTFFVFSLVLLSRISVLDLDLPTLGSGGPGEKPRAVVVAVDGQGVVYVDGRPVGEAAVAGEPLSETTRVALFEAIDAAMDPGDETLTAPIIRMEVDERGASGAMLRVLDALRGRGYESVQLVGKPASNPAPGDP
ncbi:MAG: biopolymer transporter ExbD [Phycisphaeraceae bacterium]|nr:biopolymer transporter ExbD [Phycisphaeraceae bacterium]